MKTEKGFSLIEILITLSVGLIVLFAIYSALTSGQKSSVSIERRITTHQDARTALEIMAAEIKMASYNPNNAENLWIDITGGGVIQANKGIQLASSTSLAIEMDMDGNGAINTTAAGSTESVIYSYDGGNQIITRSVNGGTPQAFLGDTSAARTVRVVNGNIPVFRYYDSAGTLITDIANNIRNIRRIQIILMVQSSQNAPSTNQPVQTVYSTSVIPRNHAINIDNVSS